MGGLERIVQVVKSLFNLLTIQNAALPESSVDIIIVDSKAGKQDLVFVLGECSLCKLNR